MTWLLPDEVSIKFAKLKRLLHSTEKVLDGVTVVFCCRNEFDEIPPDIENRAREQTGVLE
jgi:hypothetical protein